MLPQLKQGIFKYKTTLRVRSMHTIKNVCINSGPASLGYGPFFFGGGEGTLNTKCTPTHRKVLFINLFSTALQITFFATTVRRNILVHPQSAFVV